MKLYQKILLGVAVIVILVVIIFFLRDVPFFKNLWVGISALFSGLMILLAKAKGVFSGDTSSTDEMKAELEKLRKVEKDLIDTLMKEREIYKEKIKRLEEEGRIIDQKITSKQKELENYQSYEYWKESMWDHYSDGQKAKEAEDLYGKPGKTGEFAYHDI